MRISWHPLLVLWLCLIVGGIEATSSQALAQPKPPGSKKIVIQESFPGRGLTPKDAENDAVERACSWLADHDHFGWSPSPEYLREKGMVRTVGEPTEKEFEFVKDVAKDGKLNVVTVQLEITENQARDIQKQAQHQRMAERQKPLLYGLIGVAALLGVVIGYLRLEEATKGYFTRRLMIVAIGILLVIVAGLCVIA